MKQLSKINLNNLSSKLKLVENSSELIPGKDILVSSFMIEEVLTIKNIYTSILKIQPSKIVLKVKDFRSIEIIQDGITRSLFSIKDYKLYKINSEKAQLILELFFYKLYKKVKEKDKEFVDVLWFDFSE